MEQITIEIDAAGNPRISVKGVKGKSCKALTAELEKALGKTGADKTTEDYFDNGPKPKVSY